MRTIFIYRNDRQKLMKLKKCIFFSKRTIDMNSLRSIEPSPIEDRRGRGFDILSDKVSHQQDMMMMLIY